MHEFSIAEALLERVQSHQPPATRLRSVTIRAGKLRRIDPDAMQMAWQSLSQSQLNLQEVEGDDLLLMSLDVVPISPEVEVQHARAGG